jgi:hypothetical protein
MGPFVPRPEPYTCARDVLTCARDVLVIDDKCFASRFALRLMYYDELVTGTLNIRDDGELCDGNSRSR